jgi:hypothetical protein
MALGGLALLGWSGALALTMLHCWVGSQERPRSIAATLDADSVVRGMCRPVENVPSQLLTPDGRNTESRVAQVQKPDFSTRPPGPKAPPPDPPGGLNLQPYPRLAPPIDPPVPIVQPAPPPDPPIAGSLPAPMPPADPPSGAAQPNKSGRASKKNWADDMKVMAPPPDVPPDVPPSRTRR